MNQQNNNQQSFFQQFTTEQSFEHWNTSNTVLEIAQKLGFQDKNGLASIDYLYIQTIKKRKTWQSLVISNNRLKEKQRPSYVKSLSAKELELAMNYEGIQTLSHLALHFLLSQKHGRKVVRERILELN
jgi:hypothetical protein